MKRRLARHTVVGMTTTGNQAVIILVRGRPPGKARWKARPKASGARSNGRIARVGNPASI